MKHLRPYKIFESTEEDLTTFQSEYDDLLGRLSQARHDLERYEKGLASKKIYVVGDKVKKVVDVWGIFWEVDIYDHWDGHYGDWVHDVCWGAEEMREEPSDDIRELITCWDILSNKDRKDKLDRALQFHSSFETPDRFSEAIVERLYEDDEVVKKSDTTWEWGSYTFTVKDSEDTSLKIEYTSNGRHDEGSPTNGSYIMFKLSSNSEIKSTKHGSKYGT